MIESYRNKSERLVIGLMSGTSADGIDAALVRISGSNEAPQVELRAFDTFPYSADLRDQILRISPETPVGEICRLNFTLGELFASAALQVMGMAAVQSSEIDLIASHGQTVCHLPATETDALSSTLQIGEPSVIYQRTGIPVIADFRTADIAAGGQGAPLVPMADFLLLRHPTKHRIIQNIGGIANLTYLPANCTIDQVIAFDTGPGNMVIDGVTRIVTDGKAAYDENGERAARGKVRRKLTHIFFSHPFFRRRPPKTAGREEFGLHFAQTIVDRARKLGATDDDIIATVTEFTATSIRLAYIDFLLPINGEVEVIIGGGGVRNRTLMSELSIQIGPWKLMTPEEAGIPGVTAKKVIAKDPAAVKQWKFLTHEDVGINSDAKEAIAFALLAHLSACGLPGNVPQATGARKAVVLGKLVCH